MAYGIVYKGEFKDGLVYIGQTTQNPPSIRWAQHVRDASSNSTELKHFHRAIAREGEPVWSVIAEAENAELLNIVEAYWIRKLDSTNPRRGYNSTKGNLAVLYKAVQPVEALPEGYWKGAAWWDSLTPEQRNDEVLRSQREDTRSILYDEGYTAPFKCSKCLSEDQEIGLNGQVGFNGLCRVCYTDTLCPACHSADKKELLGGLCASCYVNSCRNGSKERTVYGGPNVPALLIPWPPEQGLEKAAVLSSVGCHDWSIGWSNLGVATKALALYCALVLVACLIGYFVR